jgi:hypothetical protein
MTAVRCHNCGKQQPSATLVCSKCGAPKPVGPESAGGRLQDGVRQNAGCLVLSSLLVLGAVGWYG